MKYKKGDKIWFAEEKKPYTIRACDDRYLICTKPYNFKPQTVLYTIVDLKEQIRGTDGYCIGPYSYYDQEDCDDYLKELQTNESHISYRNRIELNIVKIEEIGV